jgi:hypothetical protein
MIFGRRHRALPALVRRDVTAETRPRVQALLPWKMTGAAIGRQIGSL